MFVVFPITSTYVCIIVIAFSKGKDQPGKVANPARGQVDREISPFAPENLVSRDGFGIIVVYGCLWSLLIYYDILIVLYHTIGA